MLRKLIAFFIVYFLFCNTSKSNDTFTTDDSCEDRWEVIQRDTRMPSTYNFLIDMCGHDLRRGLYSLIKNHQTYTYSEARKYIYSSIDNSKGMVFGVYSNVSVATDGVPDPNTMNTEHSWPQSLGGGKDSAKSDMHHLFPVLAKINSARSNYPFCEVTKVIQTYYDSKLGYSHSNTKCFEPADSHKGDVARAMLYISVRYNKPIDPEQEYFFRKWNKQDMPSVKESNRNNAIAKLQKNRNPFIDEPRFSSLLDDF